MLTIGITMGCPVGIGPEIILKYFSRRKQQPDFLPVVLGDPNVLERCRNELAIGPPPVLWQPSDSLPENGIPVIAVSSLKVDGLQWGSPNRLTGKAMAAYIIRAVKLIQEGKLDAMTTCPISKKALKEADFAFPGHTEMLAHLTESTEPVMMMAGDRLRITLVTIHCPLSSVSGMISKESVLRLIRITQRALENDFGIPSPRIAVAGLNPHGGEQGLFGREEEIAISPAVEEAQSQGLDVSGPFPPDTIFFKAAGGAYDAVVCMYHDQGLIPFKLLHFDDGVNVTLGLPIVRTSVDHGTAYDIAGKGAANPTSLTAAVELAATIARNRRQQSKQLLAGNSPKGSHYDAF